MNLLPFSTDEISFEKIGHLGLITLKRERALNAINFSMASALQKGLAFFENDADTHLVLLEGRGKAFSAGGDVVSLYQKKVDAPAYFDQEYNLSAYIHHYKKPYISYLDGYVMGGGAGISIHGKYRIATKNTIFAMPEVKIGFFTDVASKVFLSHLPKPIILYICLSGFQLKWGDCLALDIATHALDEQKYSSLKETLSKETNVQEIFDKFCLPKENIKSETILSQYDDLMEIFSQETLEDCFRSLLSKRKNELYSHLNALSPLSLKIIFYYMNHYDLNIYSLEDIIEIEKNLALKILEKGDFNEGVRALLVDKDKKPKWKFDHIEKISKEWIQDFFKI